MNNLTLLTMVALLFWACNPALEQQPNDLGNGTKKAGYSLTDSVGFCGITFREAEKMPYFPGGQIELAKHLKKLYQPIECAKGRLTIIGMVINKEGKIIGCKHQGFEGDCADRLNEKLSELSNWVPGYIDGKPVCVQMEIDAAQLLSENKEE